MSCEMDHLKEASAIEESSTKTQLKVDVETGEQLPHKQNGEQLPLKQSEMEPNLETIIETSNTSEESLSGTDVITEAMIREEKKISDQLKEEEAVFKKKLTSQEKEKTFQRLLNLLNRSQLYAKYLQDKMKEQQEMTAFKQQQAEQTKKKEDENGQKENINQGTVRSTRGGKQNTDTRLAAEVNKKKRGRPKSPKDSPLNNSLKRKKLEDIKMNHSTTNNKHLEESESKEDTFKLSDVKAEESLAEQISPRQPALLVGGVMREYQLEGFEWLKVLYENGINGILADEMGLGKTIQCIALVSHLVGKALVGPYLIVAPLSTLPNWLAEFKRFTPQIPVILYHGDKNSRENLRSKMNKDNWKKMMPSKPVVLTSYDVAIKDANSLRRYHWRYLIVDEGHRLKNFNSRLFIELKRFMAGNRLLLTGTPLQNNLSELWSLLNFLLPEIFDNLSVFESWFDVEAMSSNETDEAIIAQEQEKRIISTLHEILNPFLLRRTKADVDLNLPPKKELMVYAPLTPTQELFYKATLDKSIFKLLKERSGEKEELEILESRKRSCVKTIDYSMYFKDLSDKELEKLDQENMKCLSSSPTRPNVGKTVRASSEIKLNTRNMMMPLRKICNHPYLLEYPLDPRTGNYKVDEGLVNVCGKLQILDCMLPALKKRGHKVLLFSQMTSLLNIIEDYCGLRKYSYVRLDGSTDLDERQLRICDFNTNPDLFLFLLSTRAGGLGINLTAADTVIIYDSDWNPQCDLQAQDRCHRFGQTKPVVVYRLVTANTIDERIVTRAAAKRRLEKMIMKKGRFSKSVMDTPNGFSEAELKELLKSMDHSGIVRTDNKQLLSSEQLDMLLDRRDLLQPSGEKSSVISQEQEGVFKVLDSDIQSS